MTGPQPGIVQTGRHDSRRLCQSCQQRFKLGTPVASETWAMRLRLVPLSKEQWELLLVGAAEFEEMGGSGVDYLDWVRPDALGLVTHVFPESVGHSVTESGGSREGSLVVRHSSPDPLPVLSRKVRV